MFNLLISSNETEWDGLSAELDRSRFLEWTPDHLRSHFKEIDINKLETLKSLPTMFAIENDGKEARIGYITDIKVRSKTFLIEFKFEALIYPLPKGTLLKLEKRFDIPQFERNRTHWAIKDDDLFIGLTKENIISEDQVEAIRLLREKQNKTRINFGHKIDSLNNNHVFIVHGHDENLKNEVSQFINSLGLSPIILHEQANKGMTIIEKIETYSNVGFAVVLYTQCDVGGRAIDYQSNRQMNWRARQNVILEHGYLMAKLSRSRVVALVKGNVETPSDISGILYVDYSIAEGWRNILKKEIVEAGIEIKI